jgi:hypothetical protein
MDFELAGRLNRIVFSRSKRFSRSSRGNKPSELVVLNSRI